MPVTKTGFNIIPEDFVSLENKLKRMDSSQAKKIRMKALKDGAKVVQKAVDESIDSVSDKDLGQSGKIRFKKSMSTQQRSNKAQFGEVVIGPAYKGKKFIAPDFHLFEFGTAERTTKSGSARGQIKPLGMFRKGWEKSRNEAQAQVAETLKELLNVTA